MAEPPRDSATWHQGLTRVGDAAAVRAFWARGGDELSAPWAPDEGRRDFQRAAMRNKAEYSGDLVISPGGTLILTRYAAGYPWDVTNLDALSVDAFDCRDDGEIWAYVARLEAELVDADGVAFDFDAADATQRAETFRTPGGETFTEVLTRLRPGGR